MAWLSRSLGDSVSSLTGQLSNLTNLTKDILTEGTEEVNDYATELSLAKERIQQLESVYAAQKLENERLKYINHELEDKAESSELQINSISREYRTLLEEKEKEFNILKQRHHELLEHHAKAAVSTKTANPELPSYDVNSSQIASDNAFDDWANEGWDELDDTLRLQREINQLRQEVTHLHTESQHWQSVAGQLGQNGVTSTDQKAQQEILHLRNRVKELEKNAAQSKEQFQHEIVSLQDVHHTKMANLKKCHKEEISQLSAKLLHLEQQLADARDTDSTHTASGSSVLPESERVECDLSLDMLKAQLTSVTQEKDKILRAKQHLEGILEELQQEVALLQAEREKQESRIADMNFTSREQSQMQAHEIQILQQRLRESEEERCCFIQRQQQVGIEFFQAKQCLLDELETDHAETLDILSDVRGMRQQLFEAATERQEKLLQEKQEMAMRLYAAGMQESKLKSDIVKAGLQQQQLSTEAENLIADLGDVERQELVAGVVDSMDQENLLLKEQKMKLQEQVTLLEKQAARHYEEWQQSQDTIACLRQELKQLHGDIDSDTDNTIDKSFTSDSCKEPDSSHLSTSSVASICVGGDKAWGWQVEKEALEEVLVQLKQELWKKDELISSLTSLSVARLQDQSFHKDLCALKMDKALNDAISLPDAQTHVLDNSDQLNKQLRHLEQELVNLKEEKGFLEKELSSLQDEFKTVKLELSLREEIHLEKDLLHLKHEHEILRVELSNFEEQEKSLQGELIAMKEREKSLLEELTSLKEEKKSLQEERQELEVSLNELDDQHQEATSHLITIRDSLHAQLVASQEEIQSLQTQLQHSNQLPVSTSSLAVGETSVHFISSDNTLNNPILTSSSHTSTSSSYEMISDFQQQLQKVQNDLAASLKTIDSQNEDISDLKDKLQRGTLAINDLHMDKKELEEEVKRKKEEIKEKVAQIKALREEKTKLMENNRDLTERLQDMEDELESWQQQNEDYQVEKQELDKLKSELSRLKLETSADQAKMDSMFAELEQVKETCSKLNLERDSLEIEKGKALQHIQDLEKELSAFQLCEKQSTVVQQSEDSFHSENVAFEEENEKVNNFHKSQYEAEASEMKSKDKIIDHDLSDLQEQNQLLLNLLQKRTAYMEKITQKYEQKPQSDVLMPSIVDDFDEYSVDHKSFPSQCFLDLWEKSQELINELNQGDAFLIEILKKYTVFCESILNPRAVKQELLILQSESEKLMELNRIKDDEISDLKQNLQTLQTQTEMQNASNVLAYRQAVVEKNKEVELLQTKCSDIMTVCSEYKGKLADAQSQICSLKECLLEADQAVVQLTADLQDSKDHSSVNAKLEQELACAHQKITDLEQALREKDQTLSCHQEGIVHLNTKFEHQSRVLAEEQERMSRQADVIAVLRQNSLTIDNEMDILKSKLHCAMSFLTPLQCKAVEEIQEPLLLSHSTSLPALEFSNRPALELKDADNSGNKTETISEVYYVTEEGDEEEDSIHTAEEKSSTSNEKDGEVAIQIAEEMENVSHSIDDLQIRLQEKDQIIAELQNNNSTLLHILEKRTFDKGDKTLLDLHRLESEVKAQKVEKEQILAVMNEKSRETSSLKTEVLRLMNVISAQKSAIEKLQVDNQDLIAKTQRWEGSLDDMQREALQNLSCLVRDREMEIDALKQKNETLMAVLQDMGKDNIDIGNRALNVHNIVEIENLEKQLASLQSEREQMIAFVNQKHAESLAYHAEIQRLTALRIEDNQNYEQLKSDFDSLKPLFEDKKQLLLKSQNDLINYRQRYAEIEVKYGELLQKSNASETVDAASYRAAEEERQRLTLREEELRKEVQERDEKVRVLSQRINELENTLCTKESEIVALKKQVDSLSFQLQGLGTETDDLKQEREIIENKMHQRDSETHMLKDLNNQLTLTLQEREFEVASLKEHLQKMLVLNSEQEGEKTNVAQLLKEQQIASEMTRHLQQEHNQLMLALKQRQQDVNDMHAENLRLKDKEQKLSRELERLRAHLLQIEEGYTREALESEEREKGLRNRLAAAEEKLLSSASEIQSASKHAIQQVESLQQQLHSIAAQRDAAYMQVASLQDQCQQYSSSLSNLQLVLEQFQRDKDAQICMETERYQAESEDLKRKLHKLQTELSNTKKELEEASDGLAAAARLTEQLDLKEEAMQTMRLEVEKREAALKKAEDEIHKLSSSTEARVDKELMKHLLLGYFHTPDKNRMDAIHAIGSVLGFTQEDFHKIEGGLGGGGNWVSSLLRRTVRTPGTPLSSTPVRQQKNPELDQSFSQLFVKFLENESTPPPEPFRLPAEEMAREAQQRHHIKERDSHDKPVFNPFTAPRHVSVSLPVGPTSSMAVSAGSHILMAPPGSPTTTFPMFSPFMLTENKAEFSRGNSGGANGSDRTTLQTSSTILRDVLSSR